MKRAFLLGAGATCAQYPDAPVCQNFFEKLDNVNDKLHDELQNVIQPYTNNNPLRKLNVEYLMELYDKFPKSLQKKYSISLFSAIHQVLVKQTESREEDIKRHMQELQTPTTLLNTLLQDDRLNENDFFMTLNYDLYLDREILAVNDNINYGIPLDMIDSHHKFLDKSAGLTVYHLHGAFNWEMSGKKINIHLGAINPKFSRNGPNILLVPPGEKKFPPFLKKLWSEVEARLLNIDELIIIGCGVNKNDKELTNLIKKFVENRGRKNIKVVDKAEKNALLKKQMHFEEIFGGRFKFFTPGFNMNSIEFIFK